MGVDPYKYTFGELQQMCMGRDMAMWLHTSHILAVTSNTFAKKPTKPEKFDPYKKYRDNVRINPKSHWGRTLFQDLKKEG